MSFKITPLLIAGLATALPVATPLPALAQDTPSAFGCSNLQKNSGVPAVEGKDGFFFRLAADMRMHHPFSDGVIEQIKQLSDALAARGTTFIYLPIPTKSVVMADKLPDNAAMFGYDNQVAHANYEDHLQRLREAGVLAVDALAALEGMDGPEPPFFQADFHWTSGGAQAVAQATSEVVRTIEGYDDLAHVQFETKTGADVTATSTMRRELQVSCKDSLPEPITASHETVELPGEGGGAIDLFGSASEGANIALVGTSFSATVEGHFSGFLSEYSALPVDNFAVAGGNQFGSITPYLTSRAFEENPPRILIWENPIYNNLAQYGPGPMVELIAAARGACEPLPEDRIARAENGTLGIDLGETELAPDAVVLADAGSDTIRKGLLRVVNTDGSSLTQDIERIDRADGTGRFFFSVAPLWSEEASRLEVTFDRAPPDTASVSLCSLNQG